VFTKRKVIVFIHGCFWHGCLVCGRRIPKHNNSYWSNKLKKNIARDIRQKQELELLGYNIIEVWEHDLKANIEEVANRVINFINNNCRNIPE
jgi:DNA mismatch endonuclease (patch repair protein)